LHARSTAFRKTRQFGRISRTTIRYGAFMCGAGFVALFSIVFAYIAEVALNWNAKLTTATPWLAFVILPFGLAALRWLTIRLAPQARQRHSAGDRRRDAAAGGRCADRAGLVPAIHVEGVADDRRIAGRRLGGP
jgi:uncharacterized membrane protein